MIRGSVRKCVPRHVESLWKADIHNRFDIEVHDAKTNKLKQKAQAFNVICNNFWTRMPSYFNYIVYGDGTGTPSVTDTTTFGTWYAVSPTDHAMHTDIASGVSYRTRKITLNETTAVGVTITEVGLAYISSAGNLCTHAMIQDMNGNPISIKKTSTDILTIYATVYVHWVPSGQNGVTLSSPMNVSSYSFSNFLNFALGWIIATTSGHYTNNYAYLYAGLGTVRSGSSTGNSGTSSWNATTKTLTVTFNRAGVDKLNIAGGFGWLVLKYSNMPPTMFCVIDVRDAYEVSGEAVGTGDGSTVSFTTKFDMPTNAVVYVDGIAKSSGVTVNPHPINTDAIAYMVLIGDTLHDDKPCFTGGPVYIPGNSGIQYLYNPLRALGIGTFSATSSSSYLRFAFSDDFENWSPDYSTDTTIPEEYRHCKYIRIKNTHTSQISTDIITATFASGVSPKNIVFDEAPAEGSVITIDYITPSVPKDENHVYDLTMAVQFGDYTS